MAERADGRRIRIPVSYTHLVKSPAVIESDDLIGESEKLCGDPAALTADDKKQRLFEIGIKSRYRVADSGANGFVTVFF